MYGFVVKTDSNQSLRKIGDRIIISLYEEKKIAKYNTFAKKIFLETNDPVLKEGKYLPVDQIIS